MLRERVEHTGNLSRDACAHEHIVHPREHRAIERRQIGHLHLGQQVDADHAVMAVLREPHLNEVREHRDLLAHQADRLLVHRQRLVGSIATLFRRQEVSVQQILAHAGNRERVHRAPHVASSVAVLKAADHHRVHRGSGNDAQVPEPRYRARERPARDADAHASLDDARMDSRSRHARHGQSSTVR